MEEIIVKRIEEAEFSQLRASWDEILDNSCANEVFLSWEWIDAWWSTFGNSSRQLFILGGFNNQDELIGLAPLYRENLYLFGIYYGRILKICGDPESYSDHLDFICIKQREKAFVKAIFRYLQAHDRAWDYMDLHALRDLSMIRKWLTPDDPAWDRLVWDWHDESECPYLETSGTFSGYLNSFSGKKRYTLLKKRKVIDGGEDIRLRELTAPGEIDIYYDTLVSLHAARSKRKGIKSTFTEKKMGVFHKKLIGALLKKGKIVFTILYRRDVALAAYYCLRNNRKYYFYQSGISAEGEKCSAGLILLSRMIEKCFDEGCLEFDFLRGAEEYKNYWTHMSRKNLGMGVKNGTGRGELTRMLYDCQKKVPIASDKIKRMLIKALGGRS